MSTAAPTTAPATSIETLAADNHPLDPAIATALNEDFANLYEPIPTSEAGEIERLRRLLNDSCDTEDRCRELLKSYDRSDSMGVVPLDEVISVALLEVANNVRDEIAVDTKEREDAKSSIQG